VNDGGAVIPATPGAPQTSSTMSSLLAATEASLPSNTTPTKITLGVPEPADTPQSIRNNAHDQDKTLIAAPNAPGNSSTKTQKSTTKKGPVHPLGRKLLRSYLLVKKLQMTVVAMTVVQPPLARTGMHEQ